MEIAGKGSSGGTGTGGVRAALGKDMRSNESGGDWSPIVDDPRAREVGVAGVYGILKVEYGGSCGFQGAGGKDIITE